MGKTDPPTSPYDGMKEGELKTHLEQIITAVKGKDISGLKFADDLGITGITADQKKKLEEYDKFSSTVGKLEEIFAKEGTGDKPLSEIDKRLAENALSSTIDNVNSINSDVPIKHIIDASISAFDKMDRIQAIQPVMAYYEDTIKTLKTQIPGSNDGTMVVKDGFSKGVEKHTELLDKLDKMLNHKGK